MNTMVRMIRGEEDSRKGAEDAKGGRGHRREEGGGEEHLTG